MRRRWIYPRDGSDPIEVDAQGYVISGPLVVADLPGYVSPVTGLWVEGRAARREDLKRSGCRPYDPGEREENDRRRAAEDARLERRVDETVERWWHNASGDKREALARALTQGGLKAEIERR